MKSQDRHINQHKREDLYWITALQDKLKASREHYKGNELTWLDSIILSADVFARELFKGVGRKEVRSILNFANSVKPILWTDRFYLKDTPKEDIIKCDSLDIYGVAGFALEFCARHCTGDYDTCRLRNYLENLQVPPEVEEGSPCPYGRKVEGEC
jgi:hypothetical protein